MDPLSVGASVIAVVGAVGKVIKGIDRVKALQEAPRELEDLLAEISQFELVLRAIQNAFECPDPGLKRVLDTAKRILVDLDSLIEYKLTEAGSSNKADRWQWTRSSKDVERLRGQLRDVTANLVALVGVNTSTTLHEVYQVANQMRSDHRQFSNQILPAFAQLAQLLEESPSTRAALNRSLGNFRQLTLETTPQVNDTVTGSTEIQALRAGQSVSRPQHQSILRFSNVKTVRVCAKGCLCQCHTWRAIRAPRFMPKMFGRGCIWTTGSPILGSRCDTELCKAHAAPRVSIQYHLPQWLASRMILIWLTSAPPSSPELLLRVSRVIQRDNPVCKVMRMEQGIDALKSAIASGDLTPYDVNECGRSLITLAAIRGDWEELSYLSTSSDFGDSSPFGPEDESLLWLRLVIVPLNQNTVCLSQQNTLLPKLLPMVEWERCSESQNFTILYQIVCGLSDLSLDVELQRSTDINKLDREGRSALWYAALHGRLEYVRKLLEHTADPNIGDPPIWWAAGINGDYAITETLLHYGASLDPRPNPFEKDSLHNGWLPWPWWNKHDSGAIYDLLIRHGIDPNHRSDKGETILMHLSMDRHPIYTQSRLKQLIKFGADIEITDEEGKTAIMHAAQTPSPEIFNILARAGARLDLKTVTGSTILHLAIARTCYGRVEVHRLCEVMRDANLTTLDIDAIDEDGHRAYDLLRIRNGPDWDGYRESKGIRANFFPFEDVSDMFDLESELFNLETELKAISALEKLLHHIQELQGVPEADRYPPLGEYLGRDSEDKAVPGAWHAYG